MRLIDADALRDKIIQRIIEEDTEFPEYDWGTGLSIAKDILERTPTVDAVPVRHGKWIYGNDFHWYTASCNVCGYQRRTDIKADRWNQWNYCPNCGAKMDGDKHGTD